MCRLRKLEIENHIKFCSNVSNLGQENKEHENCPPMTSFSDQGREEGTSGTKVNIVSKEAEMLQEIVNILLLLKQRKIQGY